MDKFDTPVLEELGDPTDELLKQKFKKYWEVDNEKQLSLICTEYRSPQNCEDELVVPLINTEVYKKISPYVKRKDGYLKSIQNNIAKSSVATLNIAEEVLKAETNGVPIDGSVILKHALNSFSMLGNSKRFLTKHRRHVMSTTKNFPPILQEVCNGEIPHHSKFIFGDDMQKSLKDAQERLQLNRQLSYSKGGGGSSGFNRKPSNNNVGSSGNRNNQRPPYSSTITSAAANSQQNNRQPDFRHRQGPRGRKKMVHFPTYNKQVQKIYFSLFELHVYPKHKLQCSKTNYTK